jgi:AAA15 family ATPase/GTPase
MFIQFSVANFRSFKTLQTLSLQAANIVSKQAKLDENNIFPLSPKLKLLTSKAIYGANASGKSNIVKAILAFVTIISSSVKDEDVLKSIVKKYELSTTTTNEPTFFQLIFTAKDSENKEIVYRYGFEVKDNEILTEWLFGTPKRVEVPFFVREGMSVTVNERVFKGAKKFENISKDLDNEIFRNNSLFLTAVSVMGVKDAKKILQNVLKIHIIPRLEDWHFVKIINESPEQNKIEMENLLQLLRVADLGIEDIIAEETGSKEAEFPDEVQAFIQQENYRTADKFFSKRVVYDENNTKKTEIFSDFEEWESEGTQKYFRLIAVISASLNSGNTLIIDEFDARLHPLLTKKIIQLFNSKTTNPNHAQLIFVTHDTSLMKPSFLRRDQICFVEKDKFGSSTLKTLIEFKGTRNDMSYEKEYLQGAYGAVPFLNNFESEFIKP